MIAVRPSPVCAAACGGASLHVSLLAAALMLVSAGVSPADAAAPASAEVLVYRTMMPESGPSSFAVAIGSNLGFSFDPGRGGINYIWTGGFVDLEPTWRAKINKPAEVQGTIVYREMERYPLRFNRASGEPKFEFKGYALAPGAVEFHYLLDGIAVREEIRGTTDGRGIIRRFQLGEPVSTWSYSVEPQTETRVSTSNGSWNETRTALTGSGGRTFSIQIELNRVQP
jgi:hypothetical protein